jgi:hypothetical protein
MQLERIETKVIDTHAAVLGVKDQLRQMHGEQSLLVSIQIRREIKAANRGAQEDSREPLYLVDEDPAAGPVFLLTRKERYTLKVSLVHLRGTRLPPVRIQQIRVCRDGLEGHQVRSFRCASHVLPMYFSHALPSYFPCICGTRKWMHCCCMWCWA